jgi:hypothetical protein
VALPLKLRFRVGKEYISDEISWNRRWGEFDRIELREP